MISLDAADIIGHSYLSHPRDDGTCSRLTIVEALDQHNNEMLTHPANVRFHARNSADQLEEIITYNNLLDRLEADDGENDEWHFERIEDHEGPIPKLDAIPLNVVAPSNQPSPWNTTQSSVPYQ